ncbi:MAG: hypothetical protein LAP87_02565 [Acidobacteriia bacterium]|nr:hypothetical protein [Terriglobia bacterium]
MDIDQRIEALLQMLKLRAARRQVRDNWDLQWAGRLDKILEEQKRLSRRLEIHEERLNKRRKRLDNLEH